MAESLDLTALVTLQELVVSNADEVAAVVTVLERKGVRTQQEVLDEITRRKPAADADSRRDSRPEVHLSLASPQRQWLPLLCA